MAHQLCQQQHQEHCYGAHQQRLRQLLLALLELLRLHKLSRNSVWKMLKELLEAGHNPWRVVGITPNVTVRLDAFRESVRGYQACLLGYTKHNTKKLYRSVRQEALPLPNFLKDLICEIYLAYTIQT